jgi:DNA-binding transcriptional LysR family regulator
MTTAGAAVLDRAREVLAAVDSVRQAADEVNQVVRGRLVIGMVVASVLTPLFEALAAFHREHHGVEISLVEDNSDRLVERVRAGGIDLALPALRATRPLPPGPRPAHCFHLINSTWLLLRSSRTATTRC